MTAHELRIILAKLDVTQGEFAERHNVSRQTVNRWLAGVHPIPEWLEKEYAGHFENGNLKIEEPK